MFLIAGFGNPIIDVCVKIPDGGLLEKFRFPDDGEINTDETTMKLLLEDIKGFQSHISPGGCVQNTLRVMQWMLQNANIMMFGSVGKDEQGEKLTSLMKDAGIQARYTVQENASTAGCIGLIHGSNRCLIALLGAAEMITDRNLQLSMYEFENWDLVYMEGFFLTYKKAAELVLDGSQRSKLFAFNLNSTLVGKQLPQHLLRFIKESDVVFGNTREYEALIEALEIDNSVDDFAGKLIKECSKALPYGKMVVVTNGSEQVTCFHSCNKKETISVTPIPAEEFGDTVGAGDSFAGGFLAGLLCKKSPLTCLQWGCYAARAIIKSTGCTIPNSLPDFMNY